jgi:hypothetical protein
MYELTVAEGDADVRRTAADSLEEHEISGLNLILIDPIPFAVLFPGLARERGAMLSEHPLNEPTAIEPTGGLTAAVQVWSTAKREGGSQQSGRRD